MGLKAKINSNYRVEDIERDDKSPDWIETHKLKNNQKLPPLPKWLYPLLNIRDEQGYRSLNKSTESLLVSSNLEVIPISGQQWQALTASERNQLLELVEFTGKDAGDYVREFQSHYPNTPDFNKRVKP